MELGPEYGKSSRHAGETALVEFVSANPTGPLTLGHGRQAVIGDCVARLMEAVGYAVTREYYFNDAGRQMRVLGDSVRARYLDQAGRASEFPEDGYEGEYIGDIARGIHERHGDELVEVTDVAPFRDAAVEAIFADIRGTLERMGIVFDRYYNERSLYDSGLVDEVVEALRAGGHSYDQDGATWFRATAFGLPQDRAIVRSTGEPTYRLPDIAYHVDKMRRGFDRVIDIFGADHIDEYPDVLAAVRALGHDIDHVTVLIHQFVTLTQGGETVKMSTRRATFVTVDELIDEVGEDVVRLFFIMRGMSAHLNFDLDLARQASNENPVYYLQYGHARIASILRQAAERGIHIPAVGEADLSLLAEPEEIALIKRCAEFPSVVVRAVEEFAPHSVAHYLHDVATSFHLFYDRHRVLDESNPQLTEARADLARGAQTVLANGLRLLGIRAPERM